MNLLTDVTNCIKQINYSSISMYAILLTYVQLGIAHDEA